MKITNKRIECIRFDALNPGDVFIYGCNDDIFMKINNNDDEDCNCVNLKTGETEQRFASTQVVPVRAELIIE